ncbi:MAG: serine/threonine-protein kinase [Pseudomonadota bacterium]
MEQGHYAAGVEPGQILIGKYRIERVLGIGGMGVVVAATHVHLEERVAIKFLLPEALYNGEAVARFIREARAAVRIKSEHVARVSDVGTLENGSPYMVMEYLEGTDLSDLVQRQGAMSVADAVESLLQACEAIAEAHALHIVHRDLKPANLFMIRRADGTPSVKVLDFGISKIGGPPGTASDLGMTKTTAVMGSPLYMSPEQMASSRDVDQRTDIWALGVILYELVSGRMPFNADTMPQLCAMILQQSPPLLRSIRADVPDGLEQVIARCMEKDRTKRYATVAELAQALLPFAPRRARASVERISRVIGGEGYVPSSAAPLSEAPVASIGATQASWGHTSVSKGGGARALFVAGGMLVLVAAGLGAWRFTRQSSSVAPASSAGAAALAPEAQRTVVPVTPGLSSAEAAGNAPERALAPSPTPPPSPLPAQPSELPASAKSYKGALSSPPARPAKPPTPVAAVPILPPAPTPAPVPTPAKAPAAADILDDRK